MDQQVHKALSACIKTYGKITGTPTDQLFTQLIQAFETDSAFLEKVSQIDAAFDDHSGFEELREIVFDLLLMNFLAADVKKLESDYLESPEWETIEDQTIDRGTEMLNMLLYLRECADEGLDPQLEDYLREFLLVDEDEFQDEHRIYEPVIANQLLVDSSYGEIAKVASKIPENQELAELFYPIMGFFYEQHPNTTDLEDYTRSSANPGLDAAVYNMLVAYNR